MPDFSPLPDGTNCLLPFIILAVELLSVALFAVAKAGVNAMVNADAVLQAAVAAGTTVGLGKALMVITTVDVGP